MRPILIIVMLMAGLATASLAAQAGKLSASAENASSAAMAERAQNSPRHKAWLAATKFFFRAQCEHRIPAYAAEAGSSFKADLGAYSDLWTVSYPFSFTFRVTRQHDDALYCYTVERNSRFSQWHFRDAWKQTKTGKRIATLPIPNNEKT